MGDPWCRTACIVTSIQAVPSYARQPGQACVAYPVSFPELTPYGRWFKLSGYPNRRQAADSGRGHGVGQHHVDQDNDDGTGTGTLVTAKKHMPARNGASVFVAGEAADKLGGFIQYTFSENYNTDGSKVGHSGIDNTDLRWVSRLGSESADVFKLRYGLTLHNNPTAQDV